MVGRGNPVEKLGLFLGAEEGENGAVGRSGRVGGAIVKGRAGSPTGGQVRRRAGESAVVRGDGSRRLVGRLVEGTSF